MTRWLAGTYDSETSGGEAQSAGLARALAPHQATMLECGALRVAFTGERARHGSPLCLLDGFIDNAETLLSHLGLPPETDIEDGLAVGWRRWGADLMPRLRGDFALIFWDEEREQGALGRDQLGVRSLFFREADGKVAFASEVTHLLALLPCRPPPDPVSLVHWLTLGSRPGSETLYAGIRRLDPGCMLMLGRGGIRQAQYWKPRFTEPSDQPPAELAAATRTSLEAAVSRRTRGVSLTGVLMSGGLDSASVAAIAARQAPERTCALAAIFPEHPAVDESELINELVEQLSIEGLAAEVRAGGMIASGLESIGQWEMPLLSWGDFWAMPLLRAAAARNVRMTLGGDGGDEIFGVRSLLLADTLRRGHPLSAMRLTRELPGAGDHPGRRDLANAFLEYGLRGSFPYSLHDPLRRRLAARRAPGWLRPAAKKDLVASEDPLAWKRMDGPRWWAEIAHGLTRRTEELGIFEHQRRRAASAGLQARHPLFDLDVVELSLRQPPGATFDRYRSRPILREAMRGLLPDPVRLRPQKALFDSLLFESLAGQDEAVARRLICSPRAELGAYVDLGVLETELFGSSSGLRRQPFRWMWHVWRLSMAECWLQAQSGALDAFSADLHASPARVDVRSMPRLPDVPESSVFPP